MPVRSRLAPGLLAVLAVSGAALGTPPAEAPNVLLITVDTLRPDALGWVAGRNATPALDALAREGFRFPAAVAPAPQTLPSHTSMLTGYLPRRHGVRDNGQVVGKSPATLADALAARGYATAAFVSGYPLRAMFGLGRGFQRYDDRLPSGPEGWLERPAPETTAAALSWIATARAPWFVWIHYYDPHDPYTPPAAYRRPGPRGDYDGEVAFTDEAIGRLRKGLPAGRPLLTVFAGDHGESFQEHDEEGHGFFVYDTTVLVPLVFSFPGTVRPEESRAGARLVDVAPTVLALLGAPPLPGTDGVSLLETLEGRPQAIPPAYVESRQPWRSYGWAPLKAIRANGWKLVSAPRPELYDLERDPGETRNLVREARPKVVELLREMEKAEARPASAARAVDDPEAIAKLRSLGYVGAGASDREPPRNLPDPKDRIRIRAQLLAAENLFRNGDVPAAVKAYDAVLAVDPGNRFAVSRSGIALLKLGDAAAAIPRLEKAIAIDPDEAESRFALAFALTRQGQVNRAVAQWLETVRLQPGRSVAWTNLGMVLARQGNHERAIEALGRAVELEPSNPAFLVNLAFSERAVGKEASARDHLKRAAATAPDRFPIPAALGVLLARAGDPDAADWLRRARRGEADYAEARFQLALLEWRAGRRDAAREALATAVVEDPRYRERAAAEPGLAALLPPAPR